MRKWTDFANLQNKKFLKMQLFRCDTVVTFNINPVGQNIFKVSNKNSKTMTRWAFVCPKLAQLVKPFHATALFL